MYVRVPLNHLTFITCHNNSYSVYKLHQHAASRLKLNFVFPCVPLPSYLIIPLLLYSVAAIIHRSLVLLPQLYSLSLRVSSLLSDWRARLQLCMSETRLLSSYLPLSCLSYSLPYFPPLNAWDSKLLSPMHVLFSPFRPHTQCCFCVPVCWFSLIWLQFFECFFLPCCVVVVWVLFVLCSRLQWKTSWRRRCPRKEGGGGSPGEAEIAVLNR